MWTTPPRVGSSALTPTTPRPDIRLPPCVRPASVSSRACSWPTRASRRRKDDDGAAADAAHRLPLAYWSTARHCLLRGRRMRSEAGDQDGVGGGHERQNRDDQHDDRCPVCPPGHAATGPRGRSRIVVVGVLVEHGSLLVMHEKTPVLEGFRIGSFSGDRRPNIQHDRRCRTASRYARDRVRLEAAAGASVEGGPLTGLSVACGFALT